MDFPTIDMDAPAAAPAPTTAVATAAAQAIDLEKVDLRKLALAKFGNWREDTAKTKADLARTALDLSNQARVDEAKSLRHRKVNVPLAAHRATAKLLKSRLSDTSKAVGAELDSIEAAWADVETAITPQIEAAQKALDEAKERAAAAEAARKDKHEEGIDTIRAYLARCQQPGMTAERIAAGMDQLAAQVIDPAAWEEYAVPAANAQCQTLEAMRVLHAAAVEREAEEARRALEAQRLEAQRRENDRIAAELRAQQLALEAEAARLAEARRMIEAAEADARAQAEAERLAQEEAARLQALEPGLLDELSDLCNDCIGNGSGFIRGQLEAMAADAARYAVTPKVDAAYWQARERVNKLLAEAVALETPAPAPAPPQMVEVPEEQESMADAAPPADDAPANGLIFSERPAPEAVPLEPMPTLDQAARHLLLQGRLAWADTLDPAQPKPSREWWAAFAASLDTLEAAMESAQ